MSLAAAADATMTRSSTVMVAALLFGGSGMTSATAPWTARQRGTMAATAKRHLRNVVVPLKTASAAAPPMTPVLIAFVPSTASVALALGMISAQGSPLPLTAARSAGVPIVEMASAMAQKTKQHVSLTAEETEIAARREKALDVKFPLSLPVYAKKMTFVVTVAGMKSVPILPRKYAEHASLAALVWYRKIPLPKEFTTATCFAPAIPDGSETDPAMTANGA